MLASENKKVFYSFEIFPLNVIMWFLQQMGDFFKGVKKKKSVDKYRTSQLSHRAGACRVFLLPGERGLAV